jgi:hypothetical protein
MNEPPPSYKAAENQGINSNGESGVDSLEEEEKAIFSMLLSVSFARSMFLPFS